MAKRIAQFGSISEGTMRREDLIPCFISELRYLGHKSGTLTSIERAERRDGYYDSESSCYDLYDRLFNMLQEHAPEFAYFGAHPGGGSDYGFWLSESFEEEFDGLKVADTADIPAGYRGYVLHVNDHGNMTLYNKTSRKLTEIWGIV